MESFWSKAPWMRAQPTESSELMRRYGKPSGSTGDLRIQSPVVLSEFSDPMPDLAVRRDGL